MPIRSQHLHPVVTPIGDIHVAVPIQSDAPGQIKLPLILAFGAPFEQKFALFGELLDAVVEVVRHVEVLVAVEDHAGRAIELAVTATRRAPLADELARRAKFLDAVFALRADVDAALTIHGDGRWPDELPISGAV